MKKSYILASVVSLTLAGVAPVAFAQRDGRFGDRYEVRSENKVAYSQVPGDVKRAIEPQLNQGDKVTDVYTYKRGDRTVYVATTNDERIIRADDKGNLISVRSTDEDSSDRDRKQVRYAGLPGDVKNTLGKEAKGHPMEIFQVTRDGKTHYVAYIEDNDGTRRVRVDGDGKLIGQPMLLSDRGDDRSRNRDDLDARRRQDRERYRDAQKVDVSELPGHIKSTVDSERGQDRVGDILKVNRDGKTFYRVDIEGENRAKTLWVDEQGKLVREMNDTEEGRVRVDISEVPGHIKSALINEAHGKEPTRIWQVTRGRETWYVGEATDGHFVRIDSNGKVMSHDSHPNLLSTRGDDRDRDRTRDNARNDANDNRNRDNARDNDDRNRNRDDDRNRNRERLERRDFDRNLDGKIDGEQLRFGDLPDDVKQAVRRETKAAAEFKGIYKIKRDNGSINYLVEMENGRLIRFGENGTVLGDSKEDR